VFYDKQVTAAGMIGDPWAKNVRKKLSQCSIVRTSNQRFFVMLVGYMRVSSESDRQITDLQRDALLAAGVDARHLFEDHASGAKDDRLGLNQALTYVCTARRCPRCLEAGSVGPIAVTLLCIVNTLKEKQGSLSTLTEGMDTTTASGELLFHAFGALAQYERAMTKKRVVAGLAAARRRGRVGGRPPVITGRSGFGDE
jgi:DNA invertase Pin-like site-specific DNA recombinase